MLAAVQNLHTTNKHALGLTKELIDAMENASMWKLDQEKEVRKVIKILMSHLEGLAGVTDVFFAYITEERKITLGALTKVVAFLIYLWLALYIALVK